MSESNTIILTGNMDGCHLGHQEMVRVLKGEAQKRGLKPLILTFDPHPVHFFGHSNSLKLLMTLKEKVEALKEYGVAVEVVAFDQKFSQLSATEYVKQVLVGAYGAQAWVTGFNHQFGSKASRSEELHFNEFLNIIGLERVVVEEFELKGQSISSSTIRNLIADSKIREANSLLGHPYTLSGPVVHGDKIGGTLGFKTANIQVSDPHKLLPPPGVYGGVFECAGESHVAAVNIGFRPTFDGEDLRIEAHLLDFSGDIYSQKAKLQLHLHVRDELSFVSTEGLKLRISQDIDCIREYFRN
ncbi:MAG: riboflavin biosynthesis protein RibF [Fibrobacterales bacterium]